MNCIEQVGKKLYAEQFLVVSVLKGNKEQKSSDEPDGLYQNVTQCHSGMNPL